MSKAEQIIKKHIAELENRLDGLLAYELDMVDLGCPLSDSEREANDRKWKELMSRKVELMAVLAEIQEVAIEDVVC